MIRIIGKAPEAFKKATCRHCATLLEYTENEVKEHHGRDISGGADGVEWIVCPKCGKDVVIRQW